MAHISRTFRVFVSSTFTDFVKERNKLQERVFPKLEKLCLDNGCRFQAIDLRWGVPEEAGQDQQTMRICLDEIARCQEVTPKPNFIVLLGNKYGWRPLPYEIPANDFDKILELNGAKGIPKHPLNKWYFRDDNAIPPVLVLQPKSNREDWDKDEPILRSALVKAASDMSLTDEQRSKYIASATEQEIIKGALGIPDAKEHVFCFFREIEGLPHNQDSQNFEDLEIENGLYKTDIEAAELLQSLKEEKLRPLMPDNVFDYKAWWIAERDKRNECDKITDGHLIQLCDQVCSSLWNIIEHEISQFEKKDPVKTEIGLHESFGKEIRETFTGRQEVREKITSHIRSKHTRPLVIIGESGAGKTALVAKAIEEARGMSEKPLAVNRYIGVTPDSTNIRSLLESVCQEITMAFGGDASQLPSDYFELVKAFKECLRFGNIEKPIVVFLDAIDQLSDSYDTRNLLWLPSELPLHASIIVTMTPGDWHTALQNNRSHSVQIKIDRMSESEGKGLWAKWMDVAKRTLQDDQEKLVWDRFAQCGLPLYLKLAFVEAQSWKSYDKTISLGVGIEGVINNLFSRLSASKNHGEFLVSRSLAYVVASKSGLSEDELVGILSKDEEIMADYYKRHPKSPKVKEVMADSCKRRPQSPEVDELPRLPPVIWSRLYFDLKPYLAQRYVDGAILISLFHKRMEQSVREQFLSRGAKKITHQKLDDYFSSLDYWYGEDLQKIPNFRKLSEQPFQRKSAGKWPELASTLCELDFIEAMSHAKRSDSLIELYQDVLSAHALPSSNSLHKDVSEYSEFFQSQHVTLSSHPYLTFQQAANYAPGSKPRKSADKRWRLGLEKRPWIKNIHPAPTSPTSMPISFSITPCDQSLSVSSEQVFALDYSGAIEIIGLAQAHNLGKRFLDKDSWDCVKVSPDGAYIAAMKRNKELWLYHVIADVDRGFIDQLHHKSAYMISNYFLLWFSSDGSLRRRTLIDQKPDVLIPEYDTKGTCLALSQNGQYLVKGSRASKNKAYVIDLNTGSVIYSQSHTARISSADVNLPKMLVATIGNDNLIIVSSLNKQAIIFQHSIQEMDFKGNIGTPTKCSFNSSGDRLLVATNTGTMLSVDLVLGSFEGYRHLINESNIKVSIQEAGYVDSLNAWYVGSVTQNLIGDPVQEESRTLEVHSGRVLEVRAISDDRAVSIGLTDQTYICWDRDQMAKIADRTFDSRLTAIAVLDNLNYLALGNQRGDIWIESILRPEDHPSINHRLSDSPVNAMLSLSDGRLLCATKWKFTLCNEKLDPIKTTDAPGWVNTIRLIPIDEEHIVGYCTHQPSAEGLVFLIRINDLSIESLLTGDYSDIYYCANRKLVYCVGNGIKVFRYSSGILHDTGAYIDQDIEFTRCFCSPTTSLFGTVDESGWIHVYGMDDLKRLGLYGDIQDVSCVDMDSSGILVGNSTGLISELRLMEGT